MQENSCTHKSLSRWRNEEDLRWSSSWGLELCAVGLLLHLSSLPFASWTNGERLVIHPRDSCASTLRHLGCLVLHPEDSCTPTSRHLGCLVFHHWDNYTAASWHLRCLVFHHGDNYTASSWHLGCLVFHHRDNYTPTSWLPSCHVRAGVGVSSSSSWRQLHTHLKAFILPFQIDGGCLVLHHGDSCTPISRPSSCHFRLDAGVCVCWGGGGV